MNEESSPDNGNAPPAQGGANQQSIDNHGGGIEVQTIATVTDLEALELYRRATNHLGDFIEVANEIHRTGAWLLLGFSSFRDCADSMVDTASRRIPAGQRAELFGKLRDGGMSNREIAAVVGVAASTVDRAFRPAPELVPASNDAANDLELEREYEVAQAEFDALVAANRMCEPHEFTIPTTAMDMADELGRLDKEIHIHRRAFARVFIAEMKYRYGGVVPAECQSKADVYENLAHGVFFGQDESDPVILNMLGMLYRANIIDALAIFEGYAWPAESLAEMTLPERAEYAAYTSTVMGALAGDSE